MFNELIPRSTPQPDAPLPDMKAILASVREDLTAGVLVTRKKAIARLEAAGTKFLVSESGDDSLSMRIVGDQRSSILNNKFDECLLWMDVFRGNQKQCLGTDMLNSSGLNRILSSI